MDNADLAAAAPPSPPTTVATASATEPDGAILADLWSGRVDRAGERAAGILASTGCPEDRALAFAALAASTYEHGSVTGARSLLRAGVSRTAPDDAAGGVVVRLFLATLSMKLGDFQDAERHLRDARSLGGHTAFDPPLDADGLEARLLLESGRTEAAAAAARLALDRADRTGVEPACALPHWVLAVVALRQRDLVRAALHVGCYRAAATAAIPGIAAAPYELTATYLTHLREGAEEAAEALRPLLDDPRTRHRSLAADPGAASYLVRVATAAGDHMRAAAVVDSAELLARTNAPAAALTASALHAQGLLLGDAAMLEQAATSARHPWVRASALEDRGAVLARHSAGSARLAYEAAAALYQEMGAGHDASRAAGRLHALHGLARSSPCAHPVAGWGSLTSHERRVVDLVAEGHTNRQVAARLAISQHTVDFYLRSVYVKLGVHSRVRLARLINQFDEGREVRRHIAARRPADMTGGTVATAPPRRAGTGAALPVAALPVAARGCAATVPDQQEEVS